jgi:hypothetical protein
MWATETSSFKKRISPTSRSAPTSQINKPERIPELLRAALRTAMAGRRGPVFVEIPRDVLNDQVLRAAVVAPEHYRATHPQPPHPDAIREAVRLPKSFTVGVSQGMFFYQVIFCHFTKRITSHPVEVPQD